MALRRPYPKGHKPKVHSGAVLEPGFGLTTPVYAFNPLSITTKSPDEVTLTRFNLL